MLTAQFISVGFRSAKPGNVQTFIGTPGNRLAKVISLSFNPGADRFADSPAAWSAQEHLLQFPLLRGDGESAPEIGRASCRERV